MSRFKLQPITIDDPAWYTTFPHIVAPQENEWIVGLLLRCDQVNSWESGGTLAYLLEASYTSRLTRGFKLIKEEHIEKLARALALPIASLIATTYQAELAHLYDAVGQHLQLSSSRLPFHVCPLCVGEDRMLSRMLTLPGINHCPEHLILLTERCQCGNRLLPFDRYTAPFACFGCELNWARLPRVSAGQGQLEVEGRRLSYYELFLTNGSPALLASALWLINDKQVISSSKHSQLLSLEYVVSLCMKLDISPDDIRAAENQSQEYPSILFGSKDKT
jgi:TniQ protein